MIILDVPNWIISFTWFSFGCLMLSVAGGIALIISGSITDLLFGFQPFNYLRNKFNK
tara:strand:- start:1436 stop:1606 length:171 start_codon:yes stop_codon:yes gene_type:complete